MSIKFLAEDDRPREKFLLKGRSTVSDAELLAIIMGSGNRDESAVELARRILDSVGNNFHNLSKLSVSDLMKFRGIGEAKAISIAAALEIGRRRAAQDLPEFITAESSQTAYNVLKPYLTDLNVEEFWAIFLNKKNKILRTMQLTTGGIDQSTVDIRVLFRNALDLFATGIIIAHNHPSGNAKPSPQDIAVTRQVKDAGKLFDITLLDHLIIVENAYFSFADEGIL